MAPELSIMNTSFISPVDGEIVDHGLIEEGQLIQAKKFNYSLEDLIGRDYKSLYSGGYFITIYLAPTDYHRIHCPFGGQITDSKHLGTSLYSVNKKAQESIPIFILKMRGLSYKLILMVSNTLLFQ